MREKSCTLQKMHFTKFTLNQKCLLFDFVCEHYSFPGDSDGKESAYNAGDLGSISGLGRSPGEGKGYPPLYSDLENSMDCIVHGVTKTWTRLSNFHFTSLLLLLGCDFLLLMPEFSGVSTENLGFFANISLSLLNQWLLKFLLIS